MPRPRLLRVAAYGDFVAGHDYLVRVADVRGNQKTKRLFVHLEHLDAEQDGRMQEVVLPLPIMPAGQTASLFRACGLEVRIGQEINPDDAVGKQVVVRFSEGVDGRIVSFNSPNKEAHDGTATM